MELQNLKLLNPGILTTIFFKVFAIIFSVFYLLYAIVISKQTQVMNRTFEVKNNNIFFIISSVQITIGLILVILAILLI